MTLIAILLGTMLAGIGSVWLAAFLSFGVLQRYTRHMLSLAAGTLLGTALMNLLPEAFESGVEPHSLFMMLLLGVVLFFLLDKAELWHHGHEHSHEHHHGHEHSHEHKHSQQQGLKSGGWSVLLGDSVHAFGDGVLIASAFVADLRLGCIAALAVLLHEVPHHMGDLVVLRFTSANRSMALIKVSLAGSVTALGGLMGFWLVDSLQAYLPYFLVLAASSFLYVALADLIPQLQQRLDAQQTAVQIIWLALGIGLMTAASSWAH